jgi:hypothetical protein
VSITCAACRHDIDDAVKICPYCGSDPRSGEKIIDAQAMLNQVFKPKRTSRAGSLIDFARQRQGVVVAGAVIVGLLLLAGVYQFAVRRNDTGIATGGGVPMTEVTDVTDQGDENKPLPMPDLQFQHDGRANAMRTYIVEPGATPPPAQPTQPPPPAAAPPVTKH